MPLCVAVESPPLLLYHDSKRTVVRILRVRPGGPDLFDIWEQCKPVRVHFTSHRGLP